MCAAHVSCVYRVERDRRRRRRTGEKRVGRAALFAVSYVLGVLYVDVGRDRKAERGARSHRVICMEPEKKWHMSVPLEPG